MKRIAIPMSLLVLSGICASAGADPSQPDREFRCSLPVSDVNKPTDPNGPGGYKDGYQNSCGMASVASMLYAAGYRDMPAKNSSPGKPLAMSGQEAGSAKDLYDTIVASENVNKYGGTQGWGPGRQKQWTNSYIGLNPGVSEASYDYTYTKTTSPKLTDVCKSLDSGYMTDLWLEKGATHHSVVVQGIDMWEDASGKVTGAKVYIYDSDDGATGLKSYEVVFGQHGYWGLKDYPKAGSIWWVRATGVMTPAPGALLLGGIGLALVAWRQRRSAREAPNAQRR